MSDQLCLDGHKDEEPEQCKDVIMDAEGVVLHTASPPGQSGGSSLSPAAGCGYRARRLIRLNSSI